MLYMGMNMANAQNLLFYKGGNSVTLQDPTVDYGCVSNGCTRNCGGGNKVGYKDIYVYDIMGCGVNESKVSTYTINPTTACTYTVKKYRWRRQIRKGASTCDWWSETNINNTLSAGPNFYSSTYTLESTQTITVVDFKWSSVPEMCSNGGTLNLANYLSYTNGVGVGGQGVNGFQFDPSDANVGDNNISATRTFDNGTAIKNITITVNPTYAEQHEMNDVFYPEILVEQGLTFCLDDPVYDLRQNVIFNNGESYFAWENTQNNFFSPSVEGTDDYVITYNYKNGFNCYSEHQFQLLVDPSFIPNAGSTFTACTNGEIVELNGSPSGGTWTGPGVDSQEDEFDPSGLDPTVHTLTYEVTQGACTKSDDVLVNVFDPPSVNAGFDLEFCNDVDDIQDLVTTTVTPETGGVWFFTNGTLNGALNHNDQTVNINELDIGTVELNLRWTDLNGCTNEDSRNITINDVLSAPIIQESYSCGPGQVLLQVNGPQSGVSYSWYNDPFQPAIFAGSSYQTDVLNQTQSYWVSATNVNGCESEKREVFAEIRDIPIIDGGETQEICFGGNPVELEPGISDPPNGTWSGTGVSGNMFVPSSLPAGNYVMTYTAPVNGCIGQGDKTMTILELPIVNAGNTTRACINDATVDLYDLSVTPQNGTWAFQNSLLNGAINGSVVDLNLMQVGSFPVNYTFTDNKGCTNIASKSMIVNARPNAPDVFSEERCGEGAINLAVNTPNVDDRYTWFSDPDLVNAIATGVAYNTGTLSESITVYVQTESSDGCFSEAISANAIIRPVPEVEHPVDMEICIDSDPLDLTTVFRPTGGTFDPLNGIVGNNFFPNVAGVGDHVITYTVTNEWGCSDVGGFPLTVQDILAKPTVQETWSCGPGQLLLQVMINNTSYTYEWTTDTTNTDSTLQFSDTYQTPFLDSSVVYFVRAISSNGCSSSYTEVLAEIREQPIVQGFNDMAFCYKDTVIVLVPGPSDPPGGTFSGVGVTNGEFITSGLNPATFQITYEVILDGCEASAESGITLYAIPTVDAGLAVNGCRELDTLDLNDGNVFPSTGVWKFQSGNYDTSIVGSKVGISMIPAGTYQMDYTVTDTNGCVNSDDKPLTIYENTETPSVPNESMCGEGLFDFAVLSPSAVVTYNWYSDSVLTNLVNQGIAYNTGLITDTTTFWIQSENSTGCVSAIDTAVALVKPKPIVDVPSRLILCLSTNSVDLDTIVSPSGGTFTSQSNGISNTTFFPSIAGEGNHLVEYTSTNVDGCSTTEGFVINVVGSISDDLIGNDTNYCSSHPAIDLTGWTDLTGGTFSGPGVIGNVWFPFSVQQPALTINFVLEKDGCVFTDSRNITLLESPEDPEINGENIGCPGESLEFFTDDVTNIVFEWRLDEDSAVFSNDQNINVIVGDVEKVRLVTYNQIGCRSLNEIEIELIEDRPEGTIMANNTEILKGGLVSFTVDSEQDFVSYLWSFGDGFTSIAQEPFHYYYELDTFTVAVAVETEMGCIDTLESENLVTVLGEQTVFPTALPGFINNKDKEILIYGYPTITKGLVSFEFVGETPNEFHVFVFDEIGTLKKQVLTASGQALNIAELPDGVYAVQVVASNVTETIKIIKRS